MLQPKRRLLRSIPRGTERYGQPVTALLARQSISRLIENGELDRAMAAIIEDPSRFSEDLTPIYLVLEALDKRRREGDLLRLVEALESRGVLQQDSLIFRLRVQHRAGDNEAALQTIEQILSTAPNNIEALRTGGRIGNNTRQEDVALLYWERLSAAAPNDAEAPLQVARIRLRREEYAAAFEFAQRASAARPETAEPVEIFLRAALAIGRSEECGPLLSRLLGLDRAKALSLLNQLTSRDDPEAISRVLALLLREHSEDQEITQIATILYNAWLVTGLEHELGSRDLLAGTYYRCAHLLRPSEPVADQGLKRLLRYSITAMRNAFRSGEFEAVRENADRALQIDCNCFEAWQTLARACINRREFAQAREPSRRCTELQPEDARNWLNYGRVLRHSGDKLAALAAYRKVQQLADDPEGDLAREAGSSLRFLLSSLIEDVRQAIAAGDTESAWKMCGAAIEIVPDSSELDRLKTILSRDLRKQIQQLWNASSTDVIVPCRRYLEMDAEDPYVLSVLGRTLMRVRDYELALPVWEKLIEKNPDDSHLHIQIARCCRALKLTEKGLAAAREALRLDPSFEEASEVVRFFNGASQTN